MDSMGDCSVDEELNDHIKSAGGSTAQCPNIEKYDWSSIHTAEMSILCIELQNKHLSGENGNF